MALEVFVRRCAGPVGEILYLPFGSFCLPGPRNLGDGEVEWEIRDWYDLKYKHIYHQPSVRKLKLIERALRSESMMWSELRCCSRRLREAFQPVMPTIDFRCWMSDVMRLSSFASRTLKDRLLDRLRGRERYFEELIEAIPEFCVRRAEHVLLQALESELLTESEDSDGED